MKVFISVIGMMYMSGCATIGLTCNGAVGAQYSDKTWLVEYVYKGSPADKLGIVGDDTLINPLEFKGKPGEMRTIRWEHSGQKHEAEVKLECVHDIVAKDYDIRMGRK